MLLRATVCVVLSATLANAAPVVFPPIVENDRPLELPAYYNDLDRARALVFSGRYRMALLALSRIESGDAEMQLLRAECSARLGRRDAARELLNRFPRDERAVIRLAVMNREDGAFEAAIALLSRWLDDHPQSLSARFELGAALEAAGETQRAVAAYGWFVDPPQDFIKRLADEKNGLDSAPELTTAARAIDRWAELTRAYENDAALHNTLINAFVRAYDQIDRGYWPAHVAAAEYFRSHDNNKQAIEELKAANALNPHDARVNELLGLIALDNYNFDAADVAVRELRAVDANSPVADLMEARTRLASRQPLEAETPLRRVLAAQPDNVTALGLLAAANALRLREDAAAELLRRVDEIDPGNASACFEVAEQLGAMRQYPRAIEMYKTAIARAPWWTAPQNGLGLLYTQSGDEDHARAALDAAHALDPFNLRTTNYLRLLDDLAQFAKLETDHFVIFYDEKLDPIIAGPMATYLEACHAEITREFQCEPSVKTFIEVFPTHDGFSVRTTGSPWIGTVGASTGRVIALVSPRRGTATMGVFNWARVLRHEYTHTVTLAATDNRIPHWMTEGLAVLEEHQPIPWEWVPLLYRAASEDELFSLEDLTWGFIRPKRPSDRQLAYAQSFWVCKYIEETFGHETVLRQLAMYREGKLQEEVFPATTGKSVSQFESEFFAWARAQVLAWGYDDETQKKYDKLRDRGEDLIKGRQYADAAKVWEDIVLLRPMDALPHQRLAGLYLNAAARNPAKAIEHLEHLKDVEQHDNRYAKRLANLYRLQNDTTAAIANAREATMIDPYDLDAQRTLSSLLIEAHDPAASEQALLLQKLEGWTETKKSKSQ